jgi:hypothetical protein
MVSDLKASALVTLSLISMRDGNCTDDDMVAHL